MRLEPVFYWNALAEHLLIIKVYRSVYAYVAECNVGGNEANRKIPHAGKIRGFISVKPIYSKTNSDNEEADNEHLYSNARVSTNNVTCLSRDHLSYVVSSQSC